MLKGKPASNLKRMNCNTTENKPRKRIAIERKAVKRKIFKIQLNNGETVSVGADLLVLGLKCATKSEPSTAQILQILQEMELLSQKKHSNIIRSLDDENGHVYCASTVCAKS